MPKLTARVRNMSSLQAKVKRLDWSIQAAVVIALRSLTQPIKADIQRRLNMEKSGEYVKRYRPTRVVKVSVPYEEPARDMGMLVNSIDVDVDSAEFNLVISASAPHARPLEYGTRSMLPRPFLRPALYRWRPKVVDTIKKAIKRGL